MIWIYHASLLVWLRTSMICVISIDSVLGFVVPSRYIWQAFVCSIDKYPHTKYITSYQSSDFRAYCSIAMYWKWNLIFNDGITVVNILSVIAHHKTSPGLKESYLEYLYPTLFAGINLLHGVSFKNSLVFGICFWADSGKTDIWNIALARSLVWCKLPSSSSYSVNWENAAMCQ